MRFPSWASVYELEKQRVKAFGVSAKYPRRCPMGRCRSQKEQSGVRLRTRVSHSDAASDWRGEGTRTLPHAAGQFHPIILESDLATNTNILKKEQTQYTRNHAAGNVILDKVMVRCSREGTNKHSLGVFIIAK